jgi:DNA replication protein DnaC
MSWIFHAPGLYEGVSDGGQEESKLGSYIRMSRMPMITLESHRLSLWEHRADEWWWKDVEAFAKGEGNYPLLSFMGVNGTGKTHLAFAIGWEWLEQGRTVLYYQVADLIRALRDGFRLGAVDSYSSIIAFAKNCSLLILDDLGTERETEFATEQLDLIVDYRYINKKPLIFTSNLSLDELWPRIGDRMKEGLLVNLKGPSHRGKKGKRHA